MPLYDFGCGRRPRWLIASPGEAAARTPYVHDNRSRHIPAGCARKATADGRTARLYEDGKLLTETPGAVNTASWLGDLHVGQYSGMPGPEFQVTGRIVGVKLYHRPLNAEEVAAAARKLPE